jgi:hypothetical protein
MKILPVSLLAAALAACVLPASTQKTQTPGGEAPGPWILGTIGVGKQPNGSMNGIAIKVGAQGEAAVAYDLDLCRMAGGWAGKFTTPMNLMSRGHFPTAMGDVGFTAGEAAGFIAGDAKEPWRDPRPEPSGPLPPGKARFNGFYVNGNKTILTWDIGGTEVLEMPKHTRRENADIFTRVLQVAPSSKPLLVRVCALPKGTVWTDLGTEDEAEWQTDSRDIRALWDAEAEVCLWKISGADLCLEIPPRAKSSNISISIGICPKVGGVLDHDNFYSVSHELRSPRNLAALIHGSAAR